MVVMVYPKIMKTMPTMIERKEQRYIFFTDAGNSVVVRAKRCGDDVADETTDVNSDDIVEDSEASQPQPVSYFNN